MAMAAVAAEAVTAMAGPLRTLPDLIVFCLPPSAEDGVESAQKTFSLFKKKKVAAYLAGYGRHAVRD